MKTRVKIKTRRIFSTKCTNKRQALIRQKSHHFELGLFNGNP